MLPLRKLEGLVRRHAEVENLLCEPAVLSDPRRINTLNRERAQLEVALAALAVTVQREKAPEGGAAGERAFADFGTLVASPAVVG